uniref:Uncharacterized protein n=1 Tax=Entomoneis paludosa TaxID=265537 RepID=A0A7S3DY12_9STRA
MAVLKFVTSLHDRISIEVGFVISLILDWWLFSFEMTPTWMLYIGAILMAGATWFFGNELPPACKNNEYYQRIAMSAPGGDGSEDIGGVSLGTPSRSSMLPSI